MGYDWRKNRYRWYGTRNIDYRSGKYIRIYNAGKLMSKPLIFLMAEKPSAPDVPRAGLGRRLDRPVGRAHPRRRLPADHTDRSSREPANRIGSAIRFGHVSTHPWTSTAVRRRKWLYHRIHDFTGIKKTALSNIWDNERLCF